MDEKAFQYKKWEAINRKEQSKMEYVVAFSHLPFMNFGRIK
jgi:hypothetical protein